MGWIVLLTVRRSRIGRRRYVDRMNEHVAGWITSAARLSKSISWSSVRVIRRIPRHLHF